MSDYESPLDKILREAREQGAFDNLPGKGKPIQWEDESMVPEDQRLANRLLKHNNFTLDWIEMGKELDREYERIKADLEIARQQFFVGRDSHPASYPAEPETKTAGWESRATEEPEAKTAGKESCATKEAEWQAAKERFVAQVEALNRMVIGYNLRVPGESFFRHPYAKDINEPL